MQSVWDKEQAGKGFLIIKIYLFFFICFLKYLFHKFNFQFKAIPSRSMKLLCGYKVVGAQWIAEVVRGSNNHHL